MIIGRVVGNVVSTKKRDELVGNKLLIIRPLLRNGDEPSTADYFVAVDSVGAGIGEDVLIVLGSSARAVADELKEGGRVTVPIDAAVVGIIDSMELDGDL